MAEVVSEVLALVRPGISSWELEEAARRATAARGATPSFMNYKGKGDREPYACALCVSINDEVVHSPPRRDKVLKAGDIVSIDFGLNYQGAFMDTAHTLCVGRCDTEGQKLIDATREALYAGIAAARAGGTTGDIGAAIFAVAKKFNLGVVTELSGHGVGAAVHEPPYVPNRGRAGEGDDTPEGMVIAIEPMFTLGDGTLQLAEDSWTFRTRDRSRAAHFEHTVLLAKDGPEILTEC